MEGRGAGQEVLNAFSQERLQQCAAGAQAGMLEGREGSPAGETMWPPLPFVTCVMSNMASHILHQSTSRVCASLCPLVLSSFSNWALLCPGLCTLHSISHVSLLTAEAQHMVVVPLSSSVWHRSTLQSGLLIEICPAKRSLCDVGVREF